jgi:fatty-acyl-CoA synthase
MKDTAPPLSTPPNWPARLPRSLTPPSTSLWDNLEVSARRYPDKVATVFLGSTLTYKQLMQGAERVAAWLLERGVQPNDRVILLMQNCPQWVVAHFGILRANAVVVPVNPMNRVHELGHYITDPQARVAIAAADLAGELLQASLALPAEQRLQHVLTTHYTDALAAPPSASPSAEDWAQHLQEQGVPQGWVGWFANRHSPGADGCQVEAWQAAMGCEFPLAALSRQPADLAALPYTSGTTGLPKGCMHTHATIMHNAVAANVWGNGTAENVSLLVVPMFHITGMVSGVHASVYGSSTMVIMPRWDRDVAGQLISQWRVTHWTNIPTMILDLLASPRFAEFDLRSLVYIGGGGAAMPQAVAQRLLDQYGLRYVEGYGLTETAAPTHVNPPDAPRQQCLGLPFLSTDARIVDPETLTELPDGEQGEIVVSGPEVFLGYWGRPDATELVFFEREGRRYFRTGDLGHRDADGYFYLTDRLKRMINASGFKVWPAEVEALMYKHPAVAEACVIATRDAYRGESVKAVVVLRPGFEGRLTEDDLVAWARDNMAVYKYPRTVQFAERLPKSGSGKIMWRILQDEEDAGSGRAA